MRWNLYLNWATKRKSVMKVAARLGRSRGRVRPLDYLLPIPPAPHHPDLTHWHDHDLAAAWLGHATVLLRIGGLNVLTDPVFSPRVGLGLGLCTGGPRRLIAPALTIKELPLLDLILVSHAHFDHLDRPSLHRLSANATVITSDHNGDLIRDLGFKQVIEMRWNETTQFQGLRVTARQVNHWGARTVYDDHRGFSGFLLEAPGSLAPGNPAPAPGKGVPGGRPHRILYGGDSAYHDYFRDIDGVDLAVLGVGGYDPWRVSHANPEEAWAMTQHMRADFLLPVHHSTFRLSREPTHEPVERLLAAAGPRGQERVVIREIGGQWAA